MASSTTNYNLIKPDYEDDADIKDLNDNFDTIDAAMNNLEEGKQAALTKAQLAAVNSGIDSTKVEQIETNKNNILWNAHKGVKNVLDFQTWVTDCSVVNATKTVGANTINIAAGSSNSYTEYLSNYPTNTDIRVTEGDIYQLSWTYSRTSGAGRGTVYAYAMNDSNTVITSANAQGTTGKLSITVPTGATKLRISIAVPANTRESYGYMMICLKSLYDADPSYRPYALSNAELTAKEQVNENNISSLANRQHIIVSPTRSNKTVLAITATGTYTSDMRGSILISMAYQSDSFSPSLVLVSFNDSGFGSLFTWLAGSNDDGGTITAIQRSSDYKTLYLTVRGSSFTAPMLVPLMDDYPEFSWQWIDAIPT